MKDQNEVEWCDLLTQISDLTRALLEEGAEPAQVVFALTTVAADMGFQVTGDPLKVFPVLLEAIARQARLRLEAEAPDFAKSEDESIPPGVTIH